MPGVSGAGSFGLGGGLRVAVRVDVLHRVLDGRALVGGLAGVGGVGAAGVDAVDAGVGGPLIKDLLSIRVSTLLQHRENYVDNVYAGVTQDSTATPRKNAMGGFDDRNVRVQLALTPGNAFSLDLSGHARWYDGTSTLFHRAALKKGSNDVQAEPRNIVALDEGNDNPQSYTTYGGSVRATYDFGPAALTSITAY